MEAAGSTLLTDKDAILERWTEHFNSVINRPSTTCINDNAINRLPQVKSLKQQKQFSICHQKRPLVQTQCLRISTKREVSQWQRNLPSCFTACGGRRLSHKNSRMHLQSTYTSGKEMLKSVKTQGHLYIVDCWEDTGKNPIESPERAS